MVDEDIVINGLSVKEKFTSTNVLFYLHDISGLPTLPKT